MSVSCVEQFGEQEFGEKAAETPCGSPETEKLIEFFRGIAELVLIVVVTDAPCVTVTGPVFESEKLDVWVDVAAAVRTISEDDKPTEVVGLWFESAGMALR